MSTHTSFLWGVEQKSIDKNGRDENACELKYRGAKVDVKLKNKILKGDLINLLSNWLKQSIYYENSYVSEYTPFSFHE